MDGPKLISSQFSGRGFYGQVASLSQRHSSKSPFEKIYHPEPDSPEPRWCDTLGHELTIFRFLDFWSWSNCKCPAYSSLGDNLGNVEVSHPVSIPL